MKLTHFMFFFLTLVFISYFSQINPVKPQVTELGIETYPWLCCLCKDATINIGSREELKFHLEQEHYLQLIFEPIFDCSICNEQTFASSAQLINHLRALHHDKKPFKCPYNAGQNTTFHRVGIDEPSQQCPQTFSQKIHLTRHIFFHTRYRPLLCPDCNYSCIEPHKLKLHAKRSHPKKILHPSPNSLELLANTILMMED